MPAVATQLPIPRRFWDKGLRRYGFHGLSYQFLLQQLSQIDHQASYGKIIMAHLGSGSSITAIRNGQSMDTSMAFTPSSGMVMSTRTGDLDPGVVQYFLESEQLSPAELKHLINHESGLLGVSETSSDMKELLGLMSSDRRAAEAVDLYCYQARKYIGSFTAVLNGLDTLVFSGGIGENAPEVRRRICLGLEFLGINVDQSRNTRNDSVISSDESRIVVRVIPTNEEIMMATLTANLLVNL
jgi:acetate kinase